jgi:hypothetical protein
MSFQQFSIHFIVLKCKLYSMNVATNNSEMERSLVVLVFLIDYYRLLLEYHPSNGDKASLIQLLTWSVVVSVR